MGYRIKSKSATTVTRAFVFIILMKQYTSKKRALASSCRALEVHTTLGMVAACEAKVADMQSEHKGGGGLRLEGACWRSAHAWIEHGKSRSPCHSLGMAVVKDSEHALGHKGGREEGLARG